MRGKFLRLTLLVSPMSAFEKLSETPRPWLDVEDLKSKFLKLSTPLHPDRVHHLSKKEKEEANRKFAELNTAYQILANPRDRINLLLELETGSKPEDIQKIPPGTMDLFIEVGQHCRELDAHLASRNTSETSPLLKVTAMRKHQEWCSKHEDLRTKVEMKAAAVNAELQKLDAQWMTSPDHRTLLESLEQIARLFSYLARWSQQLEERSLQLQMSS